MKIFDTHCHPHLNHIKNTDETIRNFFENGGIYMTVIGTDLNKNKKALEIANKYDGVFASIGIHPCDIDGLVIEKTINEMRKVYLENKGKIVAIGECGLDYYWMEKELKPHSCPKDTPSAKFSSPFQEKEATEKMDILKRQQELFFIAQIELARELSLPIIIHNRESKNDVLKILQKTDFKNFIFHCYSEDLEYAQKLIEFSPNCKISFSGIVTFKNAHDIQETAKNIPLKNILAETDSPYLTPTPFRGREENEALYTKYVIEKISELRGTDCSEEIFQNSMEIFGIKKS
ncbi:MAG: TatD family hydrolase [Candidatus Gracilibacteria bacterium]|nr:TatD family hydrolase [Candidatus Gracilibacteria bacterium]